jgi:Family of unknown function (DUF5989)
MADQDNPHNTDSHDEFVQLAQGHSSGLLREYIDWLRYNKKWWLTPIVFFLVLVGAVAMLGGTAVAPFIYTLF